MQNTRNINIFATKYFRICDALFHTPNHFRVFFIASVPGTHPKEVPAKWGLHRLGDLLAKKAQVTPEEAKNWPLYYQCSSIGSLGKEPQSWLLGEVTRIMSSCNACSFQPPVKVVTISEIRNWYSSVTNTEIRSICICLDISFFRRCIFELRRTRCRWLSALRSEYARQANLANSVFVVSDSAIRRHSETSRRIILFSPLFQ